MGNVIPVELYRVIRSGSLLKNAGTHVFGGLVSTVQESYDASRGSYTLNVSGESSLKWLTLSRVNAAPSLDQSEAVLEDPLTPLDLKVDEATGLLTKDPGLNKENNFRLAKGILFHNSGVRKGETVTEDNLKVDIKITGRTVEPIRRHTPGIVYKWKQGIIAASRSVNLRTALDSTRAGIDQLRREVGVTIVSDPFANQDIADAVSLLVTGYPHNYEAFLINATKIGTYVPGKGNSPESFFHSLFDLTRSTNRAMGGFEPVKLIDIDLKGQAERLSKQTDLYSENNKIKTLQSEIAKLQDIYNANIGSSDETAQQHAAILVDKIDDKLYGTDGLSDLQVAYAKSIAEGGDIGLRVYGDNIIVEDKDTTESDSVSAKKAGANAKLRSKLIQLRPQLHTKFNTDTNLFMVSDKYDKDLDLQAFVTNLGSVETWKSTYKNPLEICVKAAQVADLEFFCDTQGHIQLRPPEYNKIPLSLLSKMLLLKENENIELFPPFVSALFGSQLKSLQERQGVLDTEIKIELLFLFGSTDVADKIPNRADAAEVFITGVRLVSGQSPQAISDTVAKDIIDLKNEIQPLSGTEIITDGSAKAKAISKEVTDLNDPSTPNVNTRRNSKLNKIVQLYSSLKRVTETIEKTSGPENDGTLDKARSAIKHNTVGGGMSLTTFRMNTILEPFGDLIEDDYNDFIGPGSAKRFIIRDDHILRYDFTESDSNVNCRIDVSGQEDFIGEEPGYIGGVPILWAGATDFDLWKQYGYRQKTVDTKPFFKNAETQCAPYAMMLLTRQRRDTVRAKLTVIGNEYYQLGDVVYINSRDMLYYVFGVDHSFTYGGSFQTVLDLRYGHPLGEFLATPLDVIGKNLIKNQRKFNRCAGAVVFTKNEMSSVEEQSKYMLSGNLGTSNLEELKNAVSIINVNITKKNFDKVQIIGYIMDEDQYDLVEQRIETVYEWLRAPISGHSEDGSAIAIDTLDYKPIGYANISTMAPVLLKDDEGKNADPSGLVPSEEVYNLVKDFDKGINVIEIRIKLKQ